MVTDAAGTGFEIKKPHKGTETNDFSSLKVLGNENLKLRNPIRGRKLSIPVVYPTQGFLFEIKKPHKGTETV